MRIGILGGTFDPIHVEHVNIGLNAIEQLNLDKLIVVPTFIPPHKQDKPITDGKDRLNMIRLAFKGKKKVEVSDYELNNGGKSYSYITVEHFKKQYNGELFFIVGLDMLNSFKNWKYPQKILANCTLCAFGRSGYTAEYQTTQDYFRKTFNSEFIKLDYNGRDISSTKIRVYASLGLNIESLVPKGVAEYIEKNGLYKNEYSAQVQKYLTEKRLIHTANVVVCALNKAKELGLDENKVFTACVLHDIAKYVDYKSVKGFELGKDVPEPVIHAFLGAFMAQNLFNIADEEIIDAIRYHTSGKANMTTLGKLVFLADMVEEGRNYEGVEKLRKLYYEDFDACFVEALKEELLHLKNKGQPIYKETINAYNFYVKN